MESWRVNVFEYLSDYNRRARSWSKQELKRGYRLDRSRTFATLKGALAWQWGQLNGLVPSQVRHLKSSPEKTPEFFDLYKRIQAEVKRHREQQREPQTV